jgi:hypothetical protein
VPNQVTAPTNMGSWQIQFAVYIFAAIGSGGRLDSVTIKPVTIQVGTVQTVSSSVVTTLNQGVLTSTMTSTVALTTSVPSLQTAGSDQSSAQLFQILAASLVIMLIVMVVILVRQRQKKRAQ